MLAMWPGSAESELGGMSLALNDQHAYFKHRIPNRRQAEFAMLKNKKRGRGRPTTGATPLAVRLLPNELARIDRWIGKRPKPKPSRPEAIRHLVDVGLEAPIKKEVRS